MPCFKKNELKPWLKKQWCIPPKENAEFLCRMEHVLDLYKRPYNPEYPMICMDESSKLHEAGKLDNIPEEGIFSTGQERRLMLT